MRCASQKDTAFTVAQDAHAATPTGWYIGYQPRQSAFDMSEGRRRGWARSWTVLPEGRSLLPGYRLCWDAIK